jgi:hypothetical protein
MTTATAIGGDDVDARRRWSRENGRRSPNHNNKRSSVPARVFIYACGLWLQILENFIS